MKWLGSMFRAGVFGALAFGCARGPNVSADALPLTRVVVYRNGIGYYERAGRVNTDEVQFRMRQRMVGDFLATLAIVERGGSSVRSASFPIDVKKLGLTPPPPPPPESLLKPWPEPEPAEDPGDRMRDVVLSLDGRRHDLVIGYVAETPVWKPSYRIVVGEDGKADLQTWGIVQNLSGEDWTAVNLVLVAGAPIAFQSTLGDPVIPIRPVVTDTGEVIAAVPEGISSLSVAEHEELERFGGEAVAPAPEAMPEEEGYGFDEVSAPAGQPSAKRMARPAQAPAPAVAQSRAAASGIVADLDGSKLSAPQKMSALAAVAVESGNTRYEIPSPVTIPDESATMVLLVSKQIPGESVFLFAPDGGVPDSAAHPFRVVRFENATEGMLERGPIAVFERASFLGQGVLDQLPRGNKATVPFALERSLAVEVRRESEQQGARLARIEGGSLTIERDLVERTFYTAKNGSDLPAKLLVKHPRNAQSRLYNPVPGTEDEPALGHALVPFAVKPRGRAELTVDERRGLRQGSDWLSPLANEAIQSYLTDARADAAAVARLREAARLLESWRKTADEVRLLEEEERQIDKTARETRLSLQAIEKNTQAADLRSSLTKRLTELSSRQDVLTKRLVELRMARSEQEIRFRDAVRDLTVAGLPPPEGA